MSRVLSVSRVISRSRLVVLKPSVSSDLYAEAGDTILPHLYDWCFSGNNYINVPYSTSLNLSLFTISVRTYITAPSRSWCGIVSRGWHTYSYGVGGIYVLPPIVSCYLRDNAGNIYTVGVTVSDLQYRWLHIVLTTEAKLYLNGVTVSSTSIPNPINTNTLSWFISNDPIQSDRWFPGGLISNVMIYNRILSSSEIVSLYNEKVINANQLRLFLDATFFDGTKYIDLSGNNNHGYPYNVVARIPAERLRIYVVKNIYQGNDVRVLVPPRTILVLNGAAYENTSYSNILEVKTNPGSLSLYFEDLDILTRVLPSSQR